MSSSSHLVAPCWDRLCVCPARVLAGGRELGGRASGELSALCSLCEAAAVSLFDMTCCLGKKIGCCALLWTNTFFKAKQMRILSQKHGLFFSNFFPRNLCPVHFCSLVLGCRIQKWTAETCPKSLTTSHQQNQLSAFTTPLPKRGFKELTRTLAFHALGKESQEVDLGVCLAF